MQICINAFMTWCQKRGEQLVISRVYFILVLGAAPLHTAKSPSNKVLRRAFSIVWMTFGPDLYCVHWNDKDGSPQDLCEMNWLWLWLQLP